MRNYTNYIEVNSPIKADTEGNVIEVSPILVSKDHIVSIEPMEEAHFILTKYAGEKCCITCITGKHIFTVESYDEIKKALLWPRTNIPVGGKKKD